MNNKTRHQIIAPLYSYITTLCLYYIGQWLGIFEEIEWSNQIFNFLVFVAPFLTMFTSIHLYRRLVTKRRELTILLLGASPGFIPGAIFGYGLWGLGHGDTMLGFLLSILSTGLPTAIMFGLLSSFYNFILNKISGTN